MNIFYTSPDHKKRWLTAILTIEKTWEGKLDPEYASALYILTSSARTWQKTASSVDREGIDFAAMVQEVDFSGGSVRLIRLAWNLFNDGTPCNPVDLVTAIDEQNFTIALNALQIRRARLPLSELAEKAELHTMAMDIRNRISAQNRPKPWLPPGEGYQP